MHIINVLLLMDTTETPPPDSLQDASPMLPFENPLADILLLSSDGTEYRMLKANLIQSSAFF